MSPRSPSDDSTGHRERKKAATRAALSQAALELALEHGLDGVRIDDIAKRVGVSPRTFNNYFSSKEAAIVGVGNARGETLLAALAARPVDEDVWTALGHAVRTLFPEDPDPGFTARSHLLKDEPSLAAEQLKSDAALERALAEAIAERTDTNLKKDLYPRLAAATFFAAVHTALDAWLSAPRGPSLSHLLSSALEQISEGLAPPRTAPRSTRKRPVLLDRK
ncbi:TetR family transcriptional regulator [Myxococcaceae bacterium JPH2]|nr:TetR family transcriptional regulator [Myxococcaceae bacterium JPH2]